MNKTIIINNKKDYQHFLNRLFFYKYYHFTIFTIKNNIKSQELTIISNALNIKKRKERITYLYDEAINHHESCCPGKKSSDIVKDCENNQTPNGRKIEKLSSEEIEDLKKGGKEILYITGKYIYFILIFYSHNFGKCRCRKIKFNKYVRYIY